MKAAMTRTTQHPCYEIAGNHDADSAVGDHATGFLCSTRLVQISSEHMELYGVALATYPGTA